MLLCYKQARHLVKVGLSHNSDGSRKHILNPPLDGQASYYYDMLVLCDRSYLEE